MPVIEIPAKTIQRCDGCQNEVESDIRPKYWTTLKHFRDAYDHQGNAMASDNVDLLLCPTCTETVTTIINETFNRDD